MNFAARLLIVAFLPAGFIACGAETNDPPTRLKIGIVQMSPGWSIADNRARIMSWIPKVAARGARVVVFPEDALRGQGRDDPAIVGEAVDAIRKATSEKAPA